MKRMARPFLHFSPWAIIIAFALSGFVQTATPVIQPQEQEPVSEKHAEAQPLIHTDQELATPLFQLLDDARLKYLEGSAAEALALLDSADLGRADTDERVAWLELYAFLLTATGAHQAAFDSLHMMHTLKTRGLQQERSHLQEQFTDSLAAWTRHRSASVEAYHGREDELLSTNRTLLYALAGLIVIAGILLIFLVFNRRSEKTIPMAVLSAVPATPAPSPAIITPSRGPASVGTPDDVKTEVSNEGLLPHVERLSRLVSGGSTIDAAVHLDVLKRYMRMMRPLEEQEWLPLQDTVTLLRQRLKLSAMLLDVRPQHVVNVSAELRDAQVNAPARMLVALLQELMPGDQAATNPTIMVEFTRLTDSAKIGCSLRTNRGPMTDGRAFGQENDATNVVVRQVDTGSEGIGIEVEWPASMHIPTP